MGDVEKPFICPEQDCNMSFISEHHLQVHKGHHEMQLSLNSQGISQQSSTIMKHSGFLADQTPTPSKFLRHYEEVSLFQDIHLNPFDLEFRKASQNKNYKAQLSINENQGGNGSLETPRILPPADSDETISSTSRDDAQISECNGRSPVSLTVSSANNAPSTVINIMSSQHNILRAEESKIEAEKKEGRKKLTLNVSTTTASEAVSQNSNIISTPTPVITAGPSVSQSLGLSGATPTLNTPNILTANIPQITLNGVDIPLNDLNTPGLSPTLRLTATPPSIKPTFEDDSGVPRTSSGAVSTTTYTSTPASVPTTPTFSYSASSSFPPSPSATVLQLLLKFPDGQAIPVEIPATPVVSTVSQTNPTASVVTKIAPAYQTTAFTSVITNPTPSLAKMKLKQVLNSSHTAAKPGSKKHSRATTADRIAEMTRNRNASGTGSTSVLDGQEENSSSSCSSVFSQGNSSNNNNNNSTNNTHTNSHSCRTPRRRRHSNSDENPEEKRRKFLERNRVAAVRCREKKKRLVESMVAKSDELSYMNHKLQCEVASLRSEVASLKSLLLRHKNCPVTLAMQAGGEIVELKADGKGASTDLRKTTTTTTMTTTPPFQEIRQKQNGGARQKQNGGDRLKQNGGDRQKQNGGDRQKQNGGARLKQNGGASNSTSDFSEDDQGSSSLSDVSQLDVASRTRKRSHSVSSVLSSSGPTETGGGLPVAAASPSGGARSTQPLFSVVGVPKPIVNLTRTPTTHHSPSYHPASEVKSTLCVSPPDTTHLKPNLVYVTSLKPSSGLLAPVGPKELNTPSFGTSSFEMPCIKEVPEGFSTSIIIQNCPSTGKETESPVRSSLILQNHGCTSLALNSRPGVLGLISSGKTLLPQPKSSSSQTQSLTSNCIPLVPEHR